MIRKAFRMSVDPGQQDEYIRRHNPVWPELEEVLIRHGVSVYSIFLDLQTNDLFAYAEVESEERWQAIASTDVCKRWWQHMREVMPTNSDASPASRDLEEVFRLGPKRLNGSAERNTMARPGTGLFARVLRFKVARPGEE